MARTSRINNFLNKCNCQYLENELDDKYIQDQLKELFDELCKGLSVRFRKNVNDCSFNVIFNFHKKDQNRLTYISQYQDNINLSKAFNLYEAYVKYTIKLKNEFSEFIPFYFHSYFDLNHETKNVFSKVENNKVIFKKINNQRQKLKFSFENENQKKGFEQFEQLMAVVLYKSNSIENPFESFMETDISNLETPHSFCCWNLSIPNFDYVGSLMIEFINNPSDKVIKNLTRKIFNTREQFLALKLAELQSLNLLSELQKNKETIKSAISAIMSRNMSHNLGSHVITNAKHQIEALATSHLDPLAKQLNGISKLLQYLQERQDFVAVIANDEKFAKGPLNFKSAIFDMIAIDGPAIRHKADSETHINNYILDNIVRSEGVYRKDSISNLGSIPIEIQMVKITKGKPFVFKSMEHNNLNSDEFNKFILSIPYGLNGRQAFLTIIENIIRNAAKHGKESLKCFDSENPLIFSIIFFEREYDYEITISDNKCNFIEVFDQFKKLKILDTKGFIQKLNILKKDNNRIDTSNKGIKEILICLAWMKNNNTDIDYSIIENYPNKLIEIVGVDNNYNTFNVNNLKVVKNLSWGYKFNINKYKPVHLITEKDLSYDNFTSKISNLPSASIYAVPKKHQENELIKALTRVVIVDDEQIREGSFSEIDSLKHTNILHDNLKYSTFDLVISEKVENKKDYSDCEHVIRQYNGIGDKNPNNNIIHFRNHYESEKVKKSKTKDDLNVLERSVFTEGISGGNFTHNLIRTNISELSYLYILEAALTKIAIVDERIFSKYNGLIPSVAEKSVDFHKNNHIEDITTLTIKAFENSKINKIDLNELFVTIKKITKEFDNYSLDNGLLSTLRSNKSEYENLCISDIKELIIEHILFKEEKVSVFGYNPMHDYLENKNITILNCDTSGKLFDLRGNIIDNKSSNKFHFFSIHLSLLEKFENKNDVKSNLKQMIVKYNLNNTKISLHSGRGGLNTIEDVTFIPLSGIDWALDNCKYVLSELFYGLKYYPIAPIS